MSGYDQRWVFLDFRDLEMLMILRSKLAKMEKKSLKVMKSVS